MKKELERISNKIDKNELVENIYCIIADTTQIKIRHKIGSIGKLSLKMGEGALFVFEYEGKNYFRTSPVVQVVTIDNDMLLVRTENSVHEFQLLQNNLKKLLLKTIKHFW